MAYIIEVKNSNENFITWSEKDYISAKLKELIIDSNILIVPVENFREIKEPVFPQRTEELFKYLQTELPEQVKVEIAIEDDEYQELALYHDLVDIGNFIVTIIALPFLVSILANYVTMKSFDKKGDDIKLTLTTVEGDISRTIIYEGKATDFIASSEEIKKLCLGEPNTLKLSENILDPVKTEKIVAKKK